MDVSIREMALAGHGHNVAGLAETMKLKGVLKMAADYADSIGLHCEGSNHSVDMILAATAPPQAPADSGVNLPRLGAVVMAVGFICGSFGANYSTGETTMAKAQKENPGPLLDGARKAMLAKDWDTACRLFARAYDAGADPDDSLGREAECCFYAKNFHDSLTVCEALDKATNGTSKVSSYIRGLVALEAKDYPTARNEFKLAHIAGNTRALVMLKRVPDAKP